MISLIRLPLVVSLGLSTALPSSAAKIVTEVPAPKTGIGGVAGAGSAADINPTANIRLTVPTLSQTNLTLPNNITPNIETAHSAQVNVGGALAAPASAPKAVPPGALPLQGADTGNQESIAVPKVGGQDFQEALSNVGRDSGQIRKSAKGNPGGSERSFGLSREIFDGSASKDGLQAALPITAGPGSLSRGGFGNGAKLPLPPRTASFGQAPQDPLLVNRIVRTSEKDRSGFTVEGKELEYLAGGGPKSKTLFKHPRLPHRLLTLFLSEDAKFIGRKTNAKRVGLKATDVEIQNAAANSRWKRAGEVGSKGSKDRAISGRLLLKPHGLTPDFTHGITLVEDIHGNEWKTYHIVQEQVFGNQAQDVSVSELAYVKALFSKLTALRIRFPDDANLGENIMIGWTASNPRVQAYIVDAEGTKYEGPQPLLERIMGRPDPLIAHYEMLYKKIEDLVVKRPIPASALTGRISSPHPIKDLAGAESRKGKADENDWWRRRDFDQARGPILTLGEAYSRVDPADKEKLKGLLRRSKDALTYAQNGKDLRKVISENVAKVDEKWRNPYLAFTIAVSQYQTGANQGDFSSHPLSDILVPNKVARDRFEAAEPIHLSQPAFAMGVVYNLLFDYAGEIRAPEKVDFLIQHIISRP